MQQGCVGAPHVPQVPAPQLSPDAQLELAQHGWPSIAPHGLHTPAEQMSVPPEHVPPGSQHGSRVSPQCVHAPPRQAIAAPHDPSQHGCPAPPHWTQRPAPDSHVYPDAVHAVPVLQQG